MSKSIEDIANMELNYEAFKELAKKQDLSVYEKIGFPDAYRQGFENIIFEDIRNKADLLNGTQKVVLDIGSGCSELSQMMKDICKRNQHKLIMSDSEEMLSFHKDENFITKVPGLFPRTIGDIKKLFSQVDIIICYSVFHYIFLDTNVWDFIDKSLSLLSSGGQFLIGDIPNISKRKRFFSSEQGIKFHRDFIQDKNSIPDVKYNLIEAGKIDDSIIYAIMQRANLAGFDAYLLPQNAQLPMANRRDDMLIRKP
ncbi:class I SAM-dependent methyltransferase [Holosporaceae bacterium 'Namur']|nr:class I SAM-dependent methyltransferase [Holosporaceae bacterium 'Namur']